VPSVTGHESPAPGAGAESKGHWALPAAAPDGRNGQDVPYVQCTNTSAVANLMTIFLAYRSVPAFPSSLEESRCLVPPRAEASFSCLSRSSRSAASAFC